MNKWFVWVWLPILLLALPALLSAEEETVKTASVFLLIHGLILLQYLEVHRLTKKKLGALVPWVFVKSKKNVAVLHETELYSYSLFGQVVLMLGKEDFLISTGRLIKVYEGQLASEYIQRLLEVSRPLTGLERVQWVLSNQFAQFIWKLLLTTLYVAALVAINLY